MTCLLKNRNSNTRVMFRSARTRVNLREANASSIIELRRNVASATSGQTRSRVMYSHCLISQEYMCVLVSWLAAELLLVLVRQREILVISKKHDQRTKRERYQVRRGLRKSLLLEVVLFVPVSVALLFLVVRPLAVKNGLVASFAADHPISFCALLGTISYGFPFATLRRFVTKVALETLKKFAEITIQSTELDIKKSQQEEGLRTRPALGAESVAEDEGLEDNEDKKIHRG